MFIAAGGVDFDFQEPSEKAPRWLKLVWQKVTQKQKLAKVVTNKKKEAAW
jgi:hypothetical protein